MASKYDGLARIIIQNVGGKENIAGLTHCVTRLRFTLKDESKASTDILKNTDGVVTVIQSGGQYMVVIGNHVPDVYDTVVSVGHLEGIAKTEGAENDDTSTQKKNPFDAFIGIVTGVFAPYLGVLAACGILKGFLALFTAVGILNSGGGTYNILYSLADAAFYFLPIMLGYTAAKKFGLPDLEGLLIGCALLYPNLLAAGGVDISNLFRIPVAMPASGDYTGSVIPIICAVAFAAWLEKRYKKYIPVAIRLFAVPLITCLVTFLLTILVIGPIASMLSDMLGSIFTAIYDFSPLLMGAVVGFFWQILVMFGLHWAIIPIMLNNIQTMGFDTAMVGMFTTTFAQTGAVIGIMLRTKDKKIKSLCPPAIISGFAGVTEPAIYGITLPKRAPFFRTCAVAALGGIALMFFRVTSYTSAGMGVFGYTAYINTATGDMTGMYVSIIVSLVCLVIGALSELVFYRDTVKETSREDDAKDETARGGVLAAPLLGEAIELSAVEDEAFSTGVLGRGLAIIPKEGRLYAPADGEITNFFPTGHAIGMQTEGGVDILMHVGMDTVKLNGDGFTPKASVGERVKKGDLLLEFDIEKIKAAGYSTTTPIIVTNSDDFTDVAVMADGRVNPGDVVITVI